jgi:Zinc knuckle
VFGLAKGNFNGGQFGGAQWLIALWAHGVAHCSQTGPNLTTSSLKKHGPMAAEPHTLKLAPYFKREDPPSKPWLTPPYVRNLPFMRSTTTKTYATATATPATPAAPAAPAPETNRVREIQQQNLERRVQRRKEQAKFELTLTTQDMDPDTKAQLTQQSHAEITTKLQQTIESQVETNCPTIYGIQKLKSQDIRIHCNSEKEAKQLSELKWDKLYKGLKVHQPKFGIMLNGIPTASINPNELQNPEFVKELELQNKGSGLQIVGMKTLRRKLKENVKHFSLVVFAASKDMADNCIKHGLYIHQQRFPAEKYDPHLRLIQCFKCQQPGHHASKCRSLHEVCAKCSEHHPTTPLPKRNLQMCTM